jgi:hypothetical protein
VDAGVPWASPDANPGVPWASSDADPGVPWALSDADPGVPWVSLATDLTSLEYVLNLPLTAYIWTHFLNMRPLVFIVPRSASLSARDRFIIDWTRKAGARVEVVLPRTGDMVSTVAQNARLAAWALPCVGPNDYIVTADMDIWPISRAYWKDAFASRGGVNIVNGEFFTQNAASDNRVAISYVGMRAAMWARVVGKAAGLPLLHDGDEERAASPSHGEAGSRSAGPSVGGLTGSQPPSPRRKPAVDEVVAAILDRGRQRVGEHAWDAGLAGQGPKAHAQWSWDQRFLTGAILDAVQRKDTHIILGKNLMARRLDRASWNFTGDAEAYSDAHLLSPLTDQATWARLRLVWVSMFRDASWADAYFADARAMFV